MSEEFRKTGISFLKSLGRYSELILDTYLEGEVPAQYEADNKAIDTLIQQQVLWRPGSNEGLHLTRAVRTLMNQALKDERNRQIDVNIGSTIATIKMLIGHYNEAQHNHNYRDASTYLKDIGEKVFTIIESLRRNVRALWSHVNSEFGFVGTLSAKIRENELAQNQVGSIIDGLGMFDFKDLTELAGFNPQLRKLLVVNLQREINECSSELLSVQTRLFQIMGHFKEMKARSNLITGFQIFIENHPDFKPTCYPEQADLPLMFNQIEPFTIKGLLDVSIEDHDFVLIEIMQSIQSRSDTVVGEVAPASGPITINCTEMIDIEEKLENKAIELFFCNVIAASGDKVSAGQYYQSIDFGWDEEFWLFAVVGYLYELDSDTRSLFDFFLHVIPHSEFNGNQFITGIDLWKK